jgi:ribose/xylose/arabinose/galactoside ABC-type transport system permease subunit
MSDDRPPPLGLILAIIIIADGLVLLWLGSRGVLQKMPEGAQFFYGLAMFGFPVLVYILLKKRRRDRED